MNIKPALIVCGIIAFQLGAQTNPGYRLPVSADQARAVHGQMTATAEGWIVETRAHPDWPGITIELSDTYWDLSGYRAIKLDVRSLDPEPVQAHLRIDDSQGNGSNSHSITASVMTSSHTWQTITVPLYRSPWTLSEPLELNGMRGYPSAGRIDTDRVVRVIFFLAHPASTHRLEIRNLRAEGWVQVLDTKTFLPFIDRFGQFIHADWPGKITNEADLIAGRKKEQHVLEEQTGPKNWNQYGGWTAGPQLEATGYFRVEKIKGVWWLVDPAGRLFWSHGVDCVANTSSTPVSLRENYFSWLGERNGEFASCWDRGSWAPHGYYQDKTPYQTFNFGHANLIRKYGEGYYDTFASITHRRLRSWGLNTIGNWSDQRIYLLRQTAYVATVGFNSPSIAGSQGYWKQFNDVFDPAFRTGVRQGVARMNKQIGDPWCIGFFVQNELTWGSDTSLAEATLASPTEQPARAAFIQDLKSKYQTIDALNRAWGESYKSWDNFEQNANKIPDRDKARPDLTAFYTRVAETYFRVINEELKAAAPHQLYLGCRFSDVNDLAARAASKYCDIVSYNRYRRLVDQQKLPEGCQDRPMIIGEFHFGALDRGMFHTGLVPTESQQERAACYQAYLKSALDNPGIVGTHWFQYRDQATTGRGDGENYQIGLIDICDTPYPETTEAVRQIGDSLYQRRHQN